MAKPSKYRNIRTAVDGKAFASKREASRYLALKALQKSHDIERLELQPRFRLVVGGVLIATYVADFRYVDRRSGDVVTEDVKGVRTDVYKIKKKLVKALFGIDVVEV